MRIKTMRRSHQKQDVREEIEQVVRQEHADPLGVVADARDQIAGAFAAEEFERELVQVGIRLVAHIGRDALADRGDDVALPPAQEPGGDRGAGQSGQQPGRPRETGAVGHLQRLELDRARGRVQTLLGRDALHLALVRAEDLVRQRDRQQRRDQGGDRCGQRQDHAEDQGPEVRPREASQAEDRGRPRRGGRPRCPGVHAGADRQRLDIAGAPGAPRRSSRRHARPPSAGASRTRAPAVPRCP